MKLYFSEKFIFRLSEIREQVLDLESGILASLCFCDSSLKSHVFLILNL